MKHKAPVMIELEPAKTAFLEEMVRKYDLSDTSKAVRCLVDYARENQDLQDAIFAEPRCIDCG